MPRFGTQQVGADHHGQAGQSGRRGPRGAGGVPVPQPVRRPGHGPGRRRDLRAQDRRRRPRLPAGPAPGYLVGHRRRHRRPRHLAGPWSAECSPSDRGAGAGFVRHYKRYPRNRIQPPAMPCPCTRAARCSPTYAVSPARAADEARRTAAKYSVASHEAIDPRTLHRVGRATAEVCPGQ
jgi:hypothetical protein